MITLGSGGSAGVEGPMASLGGGIGALVARTRRIVGEKLRVLIACGSSAAIAAAYGAPIAGVFFTQEIVLAGNYDLQNFVRVVVASGTATVVSRAVRGDEPLFAVENFRLESPVELVFYLALGLWCGILGAFNVHTSVFWGSRVELYVIARNTRTGMLSWIICDYESNTISYGPGQGFSTSSTSRAVVTTSHAGEVIV